MDPNSADDRRALMEVVEDDRYRLGEIRRSRQALIKRASGSEWYADGAEEDTPINQIGQTEGVLIQHLAGGEPQALVVGEHPDLEPLAYEQTLALNKVMQRASYHRKLRCLIRDAIYGIGILRIGMVADKWVPIREIAPELDEEVEEDIGRGRIDLEVISFDHWVHDMDSNSMSDKAYCGNAYWVTEEELPHYLPGVTPGEIHQDERRNMDEHGNAETRAISRGTEGPQHSYEKKYWLWDLWMMREQVMITTPVNGTGENARVREWNSRPGGPYLFLWYEEVCDQAVPKSVLADLALVHDSMNSTFNKIIDQTREAKTVLGFKPGHDDDAERVRDAGNRATVAMRDPNAVKEYTYNGPDAALLATLQTERQLASIIGGNTDILGGISAQSPTATQEEMVGSKASLKIQMMELDTAFFVTETYEATRWYLYHEQLEPIPIVKESDGGRRIPAQFGARDAAASMVDFSAYDLKIEPSRLRYRSPDERLADLLAIMERLIWPMLQMGILPQIPDADKILEIAAQYSGLSEIRSITRYVSPEEMAMHMGGGAGPGEARQSPNTTRTYVRRGSPGPNAQGQQQMMIQNLMQQGQGAA